MIVIYYIHQNLKFNFIYIVYRNIVGVELNFTTLSFFEGWLPCTDQCSHISRPTQLYCTLLTVVGQIVPTLPCVTLSYPVILMSKATCR
jgi:hypothetical protein